MNNISVKEKELRTVSGFLMLLVVIIGLIGATTAFIFGVIWLDGGKETWGSIIFISGMFGWFLFGLLSAGLKIVKPNEARVFVLFGRYFGTIKKAGYHYVNPLCVTFNPSANPAGTSGSNETQKPSIQVVSANIPITQKEKSVSLKIQTWDNSRQKVNDVLGTPVIVGVVVIWQVKDPTLAVFAVENYRDYLSTQTDSTIRNVCRSYPYDVFSEDENDDNVRERTLRGSSLEIAEMMKNELQIRVKTAGLFIEEVRITHLAYAEEIAAAMLQRQQASAIIAARKKIVDGAVGMVKMAIDKLGEDGIVLLDEERKAVMVSNLLVVLCGNRDAQPIINSGSIY